MRLIRIFLIGALLTALGGCSLLSSSITPDRRQRASAPQTDSRNVQRWQDVYDPKTDPYTVLGRTYYPLQDARGYSEVGVASWYGDDFHGKKTASGDVYDMYAVSAAHKTLPLGTVVRVTNLQNGRQVDLLVNDRGPFVDGRIIDLSYGAAQQLGSARQGIAKVRVTAIGSYSAPSSYLASNSRQSQPSRAASRPPQQAASGGYYIQVGTFAVEENALKLRDRLVQSGFPGSRIRTMIQGGREVHVVQAGVFRDMDQARTALIQLRSEFPGSFIDS
ncbi:MAG TPA: septal ring lytic transglycosylase RlpA family lipoprotein [Desulfovibrio sp.]|jgi:rare lipoprotein A|nr:septal ring lytic transglycosylase RlpA family lipoprotein [Desulfovibrio sp.]HBR06726.1 septal ring lytic transglycosylase RlpA family lipoprotein [Desulfovibrio sp.]